MVLVNKDETKAIREHYPSVSLKRTCKQKTKRGRYYCEERPDVMNFLNKYRKRGVVE